MADTDDQSSTAPSARRFRFATDATSLRWLGTSSVLATGLIAGGYLLGDGLLRAKEADRAVTVRGLAERNVTADLATWTISYSATGEDLPAVQAKVRADTRAIEAFFAGLGFPADALQPTGANVSTYTDRGVTRYTVRQRLALRTKDIARAQRAVARQFDLVNRGVLLEEGSGMAYTFTGLNAIKPAMVAEATRDARAAAEQFAKDSGTSVGAIRDATQGYFEIESRDGDSGGGWGVSDTPYKKVRVVTTVNFSLG
ncbi:SIMPL domain-containing protein [Tsuneonella sp. YG55]|uniref:SIMPL domain-containing protein n=1 Tax=Tsuneonella litorea TaxID=2976475 RepID=A0A9X3A7X0_9SPHN|nr:SIMPL domain-containing protein [Tsuneonella litorea]MCT2558871.1 SIMPL domain-containing protein [Tsuneonella litorea]